MSDDYSLTSEVYTFKNALLWGLCIEHCKKIPEGKLSNGARCHHIAMALMEFFPVIGQVVSLVELVANRAFDLVIEKHKKEMRKLLIKMQKNEEEKRVLDRAIQRLMGQAKQRR